jgi:hypothetical protein
MEEVMKRKYPKEEPKNSETWVCCKEGFERPEMMKHLQETHGIDPKNAKAKRQMTLHLDCADTFTSSYEWTVEDPPLTFQQTVTCVRRKGDYWRQS